MSIINAVAETTDIDEAEKLVQSLYPVARMRDPRGAFRFRQAVRGDERFTFARFEIGPGLETGAEMPRVVRFGQLLGGACEATSNGEAVDTASPFVLRPGDAHSWCEGLDLLMVNFDEDALEAFAGGASPTREDGTRRRRSIRDERGGRLAAVGFRARGAIRRRVPSSHGRVPRGDAAPLRGTGP